MKEREDTGWDVEKDRVLGWRRAEKQRERGSLEVTRAGKEA